MVPMMPEPEAHGLRSDGRVLEALQRVADAALAYLSQDELLTELLARITEILRADTAAILLLDDDGATLRARAARGIEGEVERDVRIPVGSGFAGRIASERRALVIDDVTDADVVNPLLRERGVRSLLGVPLLVEGRVVGVLHVGSLVPRRFTAAERDLLQLAADRAALAIDHASLYAQERRARSAAEASKRQLEALQRITDAALSYLSEDELLTELLVRLTEVLRADTAAIFLLDEDDDERLRVRAVHGITTVAPGSRVPRRASFAGRIVAESRALAIDDVEAAAGVHPAIHAEGIRSLLGVPLVVEGRVLGVLHIGSHAFRAFTVEERDLLQLAADRAALAIEHASLYEQRRLAEALQRRLLPADLDGIPGLDLASRYLPASHESFGGDWYDAFSLRGGQVVVAVGDVVGHGLQAAAVMAQLRTALRAYASDGHPPATVLERVNRLMCDLGPAAMTTLAYVLVDPERETLELVSAGHPPPLVIAPDGAATYVPVEGGIPLGTSPVARYEGEAHPFPTGSTLVLYTDGLVELRGEPIDRGLERLRAAAHGHGQRLDALCGRLVERLVPARRPDDVAIIAARVPRLPAELRVSWPAETPALAGIRQLLRRWLRERGASDDELYDITVACQEACANAVEHAYRPGRESFLVEARCVDARVRVTVSDHGRWRPPRGDNRGRGLFMMRALMEHVDVRQTDGGTQVVLERTLAGAAA